MIKEIIVRPAYAFDSDNNRKVQSDTVTDENIILMTHDIHSASSMPIQNMNQPK